MTLYRKCDACGSADTNSNAAKGDWEYYDIDGRTVDFCPLCAAMFKVFVKRIQEERRDTHVMQTHDPRD